MTVPEQIFKSSVTPPDLHGSPAWWFIFSHHKLLVKVSEDTVTIPEAEAPESMGVSVARRLYIGTLREVPCYAAELDAGSEVPAGFSLDELRSLFDRVDQGFYEAALTGVHVVEWDRNSRFCGKCRGELKPMTDVRAKECAECRRMEFPRISPAIIVLVEKDDTLLLARSPRFAGQFFSILAGFVEPGESLESAVHREVMEETGIRVRDVQYFGSQPWPFPDSLMIGFTAQYESGEIRIDGEEIIEAGWYHADNLPQIPGKLSIARQLIDWFVAKHSAADIPR
jgi:NAD+ diphosphatase